MQHSYTCTHFRRRDWASALSHVGALCAAVDDILLRPRRALDLVNSWRLVAEHGRLGFCWCVTMILSRLRCIIRDFSSPLAVLTALHHDFSSFAGGAVVHMTAGFSALVASLVVGKRSAAPDSTRAHNVPFVLLGAALLTFGWFGFNGGSAFSAKDGMAALACVCLACLVLFHTYIIS